MPAWLWILVLVAVVVVGGYWLWTREPPSGTPVEHGRKLDDLLNRLTAWMRSEGNWKGAALSAVLITVFGVLVVKVIDGLTGKDAAAPAPVVADAGTQSIKQEPAPPQATQATQTTEPERKPQPKPRSVIGTWEGTVQGPSPLTGERESWARRVRITSGVSGNDAGLLADDPEYPTCEYPLVSRGRSGARTFGFDAQDDPNRSYGCDGFPFTLKRLDESTVLYSDEAGRRGRLDRG